MWLLFNWFNGIFTRVTIFSWLESLMMVLSEFSLEGLLPAVDSLTISGGTSLNMKNGKMPGISIKNGMEVHKLPPEIADLTSLERNLIAIDILFMKIVLTPRSRMKKMVDRTVLVPIEPDDIMDTKNSKRIK